MSDPDILKIFKDARTLLARPNGWLQHYIASTAAGRPVPSRSQDAVCFCTLGAIERALFDNTGAVHEDDLPYALWSVITAELAKTTGVRGIASWNDSAYRTQESVVAAFDETIKRLEAAA